MTTEERADRKCRDRRDGRDGQESREDRRACRSALSRRCRRKPHRAAVAAGPGSPTSSPRPRRLHGRDDAHPRRSSSIRWLLGQDPQALRRGAATAGTASWPRPRTARPRQRFSNELWQTHPYFNFIKQQYLLPPRRSERAVADLDHLDAATSKRVEYFSQADRRHAQPRRTTSATNPEALPARSRPTGRASSRPGEPRARHRGEPRAICWSRWPTATPFRSAATSPPPKARSSTATGCSN